MMIYIFDIDNNHWEAIERDSVAFWAKEKAGQMCSLKLITQFMVNVNLIIINLMLE